MEQDRNQTPRANRIHIGFFGRRNAGKSSLINAVTGQQVSVVSDILGTTTDTVEKAMELLPIGPVVLIDTPGLDDSGALGELRVQRAKQTFSHTDIAVLVVDASVGMTQDDRRILQALTEKHIPALSVWNKWDLAENTVLPEGAIAVSAATGDGIEALKERLGAFYRERTATQKPRHLFGNFLAPEDVVVLVTPIDESAPKGRMILPQVQAIREILDGHAICLAAQPQQLPAVLRLLNRPPRLVVTDSQAFGQIKEIVPAEIPLTSFSILFAQLKGVLEPARKAAQTLEQLSDGSRILISEGCTHHRQCDDIGSVKLPRWIRGHTGKELRFVFSSGTEFPEDLSPYRLIVHCGGCMLNEREMQYRLRHSAERNVPMTNYGIAIAHMHGILDRALAPFPDLHQAWSRTASG